MAFGRVRHPDHTGNVPIVEHHAACDTPLGPSNRSPNPPVEPDVKRLVMCSGKVYYDLAKERAKQGKGDEVKIVRFEQARIPL